MTTGKHILNDPVLGIQYRPKKSTFIYFINTLICITIFFYRNKTIYTHKPYSDSALDYEI